MRAHQRRPSNLRNLASTANASSLDSWQRCLRSSESGIGNERPLWASIECSSHRSCKPSIERQARGGCKALCRIASPDAATRSISEWRRVVVYRLRVSAGSGAPSPGLITANPEDTPRPIRPTHHRRTLAALHIDTAPTRTAPLALWRIAEAFLHSLHSLFGAPEDVAREHTLTRAAHALLLSWLRVGEALMRRLLVIEAANLSPTSPRSRPAKSSTVTKSIPHLES